MFKFLSKITPKSVAEPLIHILIWGYGTFLVANGKLFSLDYLQGTDIPIVSSVLFGTACNAALFYFTSFYLMPELLGARKIKRFWIWILTSVAWISVLETIFDSFSGMLAGQTAHPVNIQISLIVSVFFIHIFFVVFAFMYRSGKDWIKNEQIKRQLAEDKLSAELDFLKAQINPHFFFNTLNSLYSLALGSRSETADSIAKLSHLMRYMIYDSKEDQVPLSKEIHYLEDYIELQKLRSVSTDEVAKIIIEFDYKGEVNSITIAPMLLIPIVENAFKHGISMVEKSEIFITLEVKDNLLDLFIKNTNLKRPSTNIGGVGLKNLRRRLELLYPKGFELNITEEKNYFYTQFQLNLSNEDSGYSYR